MGNDEKRKIQKWRDEDPAGQFFFELIDSVKGRTQIAASVDASQDLPASLETAEDLLLRILSEGAEPEEEQQFIDAILLSPVFYRRTLAMLATSQKDSLDEIPEIAQINVASDEEILSKVIGVKNGRSTIAASGNGPGHERSSRKRGGLFDFVGRLPRWAYVVPIVAVIFTVILIRFQSDQGAKYVYDNAVPYDPDSSTLRSAIEDAAAGSFGPYVSRFDQGMSEYLARSYTEAAQIFASLEAALRFEKESASPQRPEREFLTNYHLYSGLSYFALWRTEQGLDYNLRTEYGRKTITHLTQSYDWAKGLEFADKDALVYFLGLAQGLSGNRADAVPYLSEVKPTSEFYADAVNRIADWTP
jgi:hypothetical protein